MPAILACGQTRCTRNRVVIVILAKFRESVSRSSPLRLFASYVQLHCHHGWLLLPIYHEIAKYEDSVQKYPNIKPGEDFKGYPQPGSPSSGH
jgi:hypothetical protein